MLFDWFTIGAQALNFLILVWLMKRFLYRPVLNAIAVREKLIAEELADADAKKAEAQEERDEFQRKNEEFDQQRAGMMNSATDEAKSEAHRLMQEARKAADAMSAKRLATLRSDARDLNQTISLRAGQEVFAIARKALADLAGVTLEEQMSVVFIRRLGELSGEAKATLVKAIKSASEPAIVRSAFDLPEGQRTTLQDAINKIFPVELPIRFETAPDLINGIELTINGQKVAWSITYYLTALEKELDELLKDNRQHEESEPGIISP